jgi:hypothetical protein
MVNDRAINKITGLFKKPVDILLYLVFILAILKLIDLYTDINDHEDNWNEFKEQHHCQLKEKATGDLELAWLCDDGKTYYRWRQVKK